MELGNASDLNTQRWQEIAFLRNETQEAIVYKSSEYGIFQNYLPHGKVA